MMKKVLEVNDLEADEFENYNRKDDDSLIRVIERLQTALKNEFGSI